MLPLLKGAAAATTAYSPGRKRRWPLHFATLAVMFVLATLASMTVTTLLIPLLQGRGVSPAMAALVLGALGVAQLPGRIWLLRHGRHPQGRLLTVAPMALQSMGLLAIALATSLWLVTIGVTIFGLGAGLQTLAKPWLIQVLYGVDESGRWNGEIARVQGFARAIGPVTAAVTASWGGTPWVIAGVGSLLALIIPFAQRLPMPSQGVSEFDFRAAR